MNRNYLNFQGFLLAFLIGLISCSEVYYPNLDEGEKILVVNGIISNKQKSHYFNLSWARSFNSSDPFETISNAIVYITDNCDEEFYLTSIGDGIYCTDSLLFKPEVGNTYTLHIVLDNGDLYQSDPQVLLPIQTFDNIFGVVEHKDFLVDIQNSTLVQSYEGINTYLNFSFSEKIIPRYRFSVDLLIEYAYDVNSGMSQNTNFCWLMVNPNRNINLLGSKYDSESPNKIKHSICFLPKAKEFWRLEHDYSIFIIRLNYFRLNEDTYSFYKNAYDQLEANNSIFDPIAVQLKGNIKCINNSKKIALGFFEASSNSDSTFIIFERSSSEVNYLELNDFSFSFSNYGCILNNPPSFWYTNFLKN